jgi:shikimate 5-dehydrogenase
MLLWQGVYAFEWWFDRPAPADVMQQGLEAALAKASP